MNQEPWTFARYWREVFGPFGSALSFLQSAPVHRDDVARIVRELEDASLEDASQRPPEWDDFSQRARTLLLDALDVYSAEADDPEVRRE